MLIDPLHHHELDGRRLRQQLFDEKPQPRYHRWRQ
jgi:hypothetical protein